MSMRVPQAKLFNDTVALNAVGWTSFIANCATVSVVPICSPTMPGRIAMTSPTASSAAIPTAADVSHR